MSPPTGPDLRTAPRIDRQALADAPFPFFCTGVPPRLLGLHLVPADLQLVAGPFTQLLSFHLVCVRTVHCLLTQISSQDWRPSPTLALQLPVLSLRPTGPRSPSWVGLVVTVCHPTLSPGCCHLPSLPTWTLHGFSAVQRPGRNALGSLFPLPRALPCKCALGSRVTSLSLQEKSVPTLSPRVQFLLCRGGRGVDQASIMWTENECMYISSRALTSFLL